MRRKNYKHPKSDGNLGEFLALDVQIGKDLVAHRTASPSNTAALATAGGVVFGGDWDRHMYAYDAATGKILWQTRLPTSAQGFPITYLGERQAVRGDAGGHRRRKLVDAHRAGAGAGDPPAELRQLDAGVRAAGACALKMCDAAKDLLRGGSSLLAGALLGAAARSGPPSGMASTPRRRRSAAARHTRSPALPATPKTCVAGAPPRAWSRRALRSSGSDMSVGDLFERTRTLMPSDRPGSLSGQTYADIMAFIAQKNGYPAGPKELDDDLAVLKGIRITAKPR